MAKLVTPKDIFAELLGTPLDASRVVSTQGGYGPSKPRLQIFPFYNSRDEYFLGIHVIDSLRRDELQLLLGRQDFSHVCLHHGQLTIFLKPEKK